MQSGSPASWACVCVCVCVCEREMLMEKGLQRGAEHLLQFQGNPVVRVRATPRQHTQLCRDLSVKSLPRRRGRAVGRWLAPTHVSMYHTMDLCEHGLRVRQLNPHIARGTDFLTTASDRGLLCALSRLQ